MHPYYEPGIEHVLVNYRLNQYAIDLYGNIRNLKTGHHLKPFIDRCGYHRYSLWTIDGMRYTYVVHRLVAGIFIPNPFNYPQVNHIDGNKSNNYYLNLEWCTNLQNAHHAMQNNLMPHAKINENTCHQICSMLELGYRLVDISKQLNIPYTTVQSIKYNKTWMHISKDYKF